MRLEHPTRRIAIIQGHPDPTGHHLVYAMADAYAEDATAASPFCDHRRSEKKRLADPTKSCNITGE
jgi:hypothetical protein